MPADEIAQSIRRQVELAAEGGEVTALGVGVPGVILDGVVAESPNLQQMKGLCLQAVLSEAFPSAVVRVLNDADALAAGIAATRGELDRLVRVWWLGTGVGYGRYPWAPAMGEGGHCVVTLDPRSASAAAAGSGTWKGSWATG